MTAGAHVQPVVTAIALLFPFLPSSDYTSARHTMPHRELPPRLASLLDVAPTFAGKSNEQDV